MAGKVSLEGVSKFYASRPVLRGISRDFSGVTLICGPNGSGKSTLLRVIAGLCRPDAGKARVEGAVGYLGHATFIYPGLTARENLVFWARANGLARIDFESLLARVGLEKHAGRRARVFSRGMAQRLNLARVLMLGASVLLLDEPATGLDGESRGILRDEIAGARARGACVLLVSHDQRDRCLADTVLGLVKGRLEEA